MKTVLRRHSPSISASPGAAAITIGNFDGLHEGHRALISEVVREKAALGQNARAIVVSFYPHPGEVLGKAQHLPRITTLHQKLDILSGWGVDELYLIHFTKKFSKLPAKLFIHDILIKNLALSNLVIGPDARIGHNKEGTPEFIANELKTLGRKCRVVPFVDTEGSAISSRRIRSLIEIGDVESAAILLGRPFTYRSRIVSGDKRGRTIGYPTANFHPNEQVVPKNGIYAARVKMGQTTYGAAVSIGVRPTFAGQGVKIEAHILDYSGPEIYGKTIEVSFVARIRDEEKFSGVAELRENIERDILRIRRILGETSK